MEGSRRRRSRKREPGSSDSSTSSDDDLPPNDDPCRHCGLPNHPELVGAPAWTRVAEEAPLLEEPPPLMEAPPLVEEAAPLLELRPLMVDSFWALCRSCCVTAVTAATTPPA